MIMKMEMSSICVPVSSVESIHRYRSATNFKTHEHKWKAHKQQMVLLNFVLLSVYVCVCLEETTKKIPLFVHKLHVNNSGNP